MITSRWTTHQSQLHFEKIKIRLMLRYTNDKSSKENFFACVRRLLSSKALLPLTLNFFCGFQFCSPKGRQQYITQERVKGMENISWKIQWELYIKMRFFRMYENFIKILGSIFWECKSFNQYISPNELIKGCWFLSSHPKFSLKLVKM